MIDNSQRTSLYTVVKEHLLHMIHSGMYAIGAKLPTESQFCDQFQVSRTTIRLALQQLELEGKVLRTQGKGTFVCGPKIEDTLSNNVKSFVEQMKSLGLETGSTVLSLNLQPADQHLAEVLKLADKDPVIQLIRLRYAGTEPLQYATSYVPWRIAPGLIQDDCKGSLFELLRNKYDAVPYRAAEAIEPIVVQEETVANYLHVPKGAPAFMVKSVTYSEQNIPLEYANIIVRGDRLKFTIERMF